MSVTVCSSCRQSLQWKPRHRPLQHRQLCNTVDTATYTPQQTSHWPHTDHSHTLTTHTTHTHNTHTCTGFYQVVRKYARCNYVELRSFPRPCNTTPSKISWRPVERWLYFLLLAIVLIVTTGSNGGRNQSVFEGNMHCEFIPDPKHWKCFIIYLICHVRANALPDISTEVSVSRRTIVLSQQKCQCLGLGRLTSLLSLSRPFTSRVEMGQSSADAEVRPNVRLGNMWLFGRTSANIRRHLWLRICGFLRSPLALTKVNKLNTLTISY